MKLSELKKQIEDTIIEILSEAGEKTAMVTTKDGTTSAIEYTSDDELAKIGDNTDIKSIKTGAGRQVKKR
jgi:hypothetical protein